MGYFNKMKNKLAFPTNCISSFLFSPPAVAFPLFSKIDCLAQLATTVVCLEI